MKNPLNILWLKIHQAIANFNLDQILSKHSSLSSKILLFLSSHNDQQTAWTIILHKTLPFFPKVGLNKDKKQSDIVLGIAQATSNSCKTKFDKLEAKLQSKNTWFRVSDSDLHIEHQFGNKELLGRRFCTTSQVGTLPRTSSHEKFWIFIGTDVFQIIL